MGTHEQGHDERLIRVWWGDTVLSTYRADASLATRYVSEIARGFSGLRFTIDPMPPGVPTARELPARQLWSLTP